MSRVTVRYISIAVGLAILVLLIVDFNSRISQLHQLSSEEVLVGATATSLVQTQEAYKTQIAFATSPAGVLQWAYEEEHLVKPGENLAIPIEEGSPPTPVPTPQPTVESVQNWQLWYSLFFGQHSP
ncbi:MAG TPA: hypothetical protein VMS73_01625 [Anaerolineaceae bacterium]|nr:hypothetical protein [Anaerolineaceae bacterium]